MTEPMTWRKAVRRIAATTAQASGAAVLAWVGLWATGWDWPVAKGILIGSLLVPVLTAAHRLAQAWNEREWAGELERARQEVVVVPRRMRDAGAIDNLLLIGIILGALCALVVCIIIWR